jgi:hypothetical protein
MAERDRRIQMGNIKLFAIATALILAGVGGWAASSTQARVTSVTGVGIEPLQIMMNATRLPEERYADFSSVFN